MEALTTIWFGCANAWRRAARFGVSPTTAVCCAVPSPIWSPTTTGPVAMPTRTREFNPGRLRERGIQFRHRIDDVETRPHRALGLVLMGARVAEIDEDAVAHVFRDKAVEMADRRTATVLIRGDDIAQILGVHPGRERRRSHQVAKHHASAGGARPGPAPVREAALMLVLLSRLGPAARSRAQRWRKGACGDGRPRSRRWRSGPRPSGPAGRLRRHHCRGTPARIEQDRAAAANSQHRSPSQVPFTRETQHPPLAPRPQQGRFTLLRSAVWRSTGR